MAEVDLDELGRRKAIECFESMKDFVSRDSNGKPDIPKLKEKLLNLDMSLSSSKFIVSVFPEFFARGRDMLQPYYVCCAKEGSSIEDLYKGDFSFLERYEKDYPLLERIAILLKNNQNMHRIIDSAIIKDAGQEILGDGVLKYPEVLEQVAVENGVYYSKERKTISYYEAKSLLESDKDNEYLQFCVRALEFGKYLSDNELWKEDKTISYHENERDIIEKKLNNAKMELEAVQERLGIGKGRLRAFLARFKRSYKNDKKAEVELQKDIQSRIGEKRRNQKKLDDFYRKSKIRELYKKKYRDKIIKYVNPILKQVLVEDSDSDEDKKRICQMIDNFIEYYYSSEEKQIIKFDSAINLFNPIVYVGNKKIPWDEHIARFYNPIIITCGISEAFLEFEKLENKDIFSIIQIVRKIFEGMSSDSDHNIPEKGYRTFDLDDTFSQFLKSAPKPEEIPQCLEKLNIYLQHVLNEKDLEQYVSGVDTVFSSLMRIHPFTDGNGRLGKYLIRILMAHRGIIVPAFYKEIPSSYVMNKGYSKFILENGVDITGQDRLHQRKYNMENEDENTTDYGGKS